jgi:S-adenosylmethionine decarboxylase
MVEGEGCEWLVEAHGCDPELLRSKAALDALFSELRADLDLHPVAASEWHAFPGPGGLTGVQLLAESHLTCHTFPEYGSMCLNLFCCRPRREWDFAGRLKRQFGARRVTVRRLDRPYKERA